MNKNLKLKLIVAMCKNNGIGINNKIPWKISEDMVYFSKKTIGKYKCSGDDKKNAVVMGRNTWESLPKKYKPLPNRLNVVLTRSRNGDKYNDNTNEVTFVSCIDDAMDLCYQEDERLEKGEKGEKGDKKGKLHSYHLNDIWIIGGSSVYQEFIKRDLGINNNNNKNNTCISKYYITYIDKDYKCDTYFPLLENMNKYYLTHFEKHKCIDNNAPNDAPLHVYYIVFKKIDYVDEKIIQTLFTPHKSKNKNKSNLTLYIKKTDNHEYECNDNYENKNDNEYEILFSMFCS
jgi:dihydrofolate reductase